jgi:hypothetical protein
MSEIVIDPESEAQLVAKFFNTLIMERVPESVAKELAMAWIAAKAPVKLSE